VDGSFKLTSEDKATKFNCEKLEAPAAESRLGPQVLPSPAGYCDERDLICDKSMLHCEDQRIGRPNFHAHLFQMDHNRPFGLIQNERLPPNGAAHVGANWPDSVKPASMNASPPRTPPQPPKGQTETPAEREGTAGVPVTGPFRRGSVTEVPPWELTTIDIQKR
jgi:hypothetical protein